MSKYRKKQQQQNGPFAYFMGALCCVGLPAFVTAVAPVTYLSFQRHENTVTATARICFFFVVPYATKSQTNVANVGTRHHAGTYERKPGETHHVKSEDESFLVVQSPEGTFDVSVSLSISTTNCLRLRHFLQIQAQNHSNLPASPIGSSLYLQEVRFLC